MQELLQHLSLDAQQLTAILITTGRIVGILIGAWIVIGLAQRGVRAMRMRIASRMDDREAAQRAETLGRVIRNLIAVVVWLIAGMLVLSEFGVSLAPILGAAGVAGLAIGFGAQSLVKDFFTGFFLLLENQIRQGDAVTIADHSGTVEAVTLRYVQLRDYEGHVHFVPNGMITSVVNKSRGFAHAVINVGVSYSADLDQTMEVMRAVGAALRQDAVFADRLLGDLDMAGVEDLGDSAVMIRARIRTTPGDQWTVRREYLRRLKRALDDAGIEIPFPQVVMHSPAPLARPER
jgi:moderate conductance mechanosensitive channel